MLLNGKTAILNSDNNLSLKTRGKETFLHWITRSVNGHVAGIETISVITDTDTCETIFFRTMYAFEHEVVKKAIFSEYGQARGYTDRFEYDYNNSLIKIGACKFSNFKDARDCLFNFSEDYFDESIDCYVPDYIDRMLDYEDFSNREACC